MRSHAPGLHPPIGLGLLAAMLMAAGVSGWAADTPALKDTFREQFLVGVAVNPELLT